MCIIFFLGIDLCIQLMVYIAFVVTSLPLFLHSHARETSLWKSRSATQQLLKHLSPIKIRTESYNRRRKSLHSEVASVYNLLFRNRFVYSTNGLHYFRGYFLALIPAFTCTRNITLGLIYVFLLTPIEPSLTLIWNDHSF